MAVFRPFVALFLPTTKQVQTVILRCWTGLILNWFKSYNKKRKIDNLKIRWQKIVKNFDKSDKVDIFSIYNIKYKKEGVISYLDIDY